MASKPNTMQKVTMLGRESKIFLLTILKQGYITAEQKQNLSSLLEVETIHIGYVSNADDLKELKQIFDEIESEHEKRIKEGFTELSDLNHDTINEALKTNKADANYNKEN